ncbi:hypothetical protein B0A48_04160 [Cryoendolithus antarcticus]|uniref:BED-type domain-containing protein n=1 Tax=Cryoendolithus antarcticus TaxID=1507870 RepID=A0A1V8THJ9_9PEZI|nr:hypothetical protein B0A48_04160 [Cryoendolithus antarcticus]
MSGLEVVAVVGCVAAVVSAFHGAAELTDIIKERREKKRKRRDREKDMEQAVQERMLHTSLVQGARQIDQTGLERRQQFGYAFERGDLTATSELKDVVIRLQGEVIRALQIARDVENAALNMQILHDASISNRLEAIRSMDGLCYRITVAMEVPRSLDAEPDLQRFMSREPVPAPAMLTLQRRGSDESLASFQTARMALPAAVSIPSASAGPSVRNPRFMLSPPSGSLQRGGSIASLAPSFAWLAPQLRRNADENVTLRSFSMGDNTRPQSRIGNLDGGITQEMNVMSLRYTSTLAPDSRSSAAQPAGLSIPRLGRNRLDSAVAVDQGLVDLQGQHYGVMSELPKADNDDAGAAVAASSSASSPSGSTHHSIDGPSRSGSAPVVPTQDTLSMLPDRSNMYSLSLRPTVSTPTGPSSSSGSRSSAEHLMWSPEHDEVWSPLSEPTAHNKYHGFCKGAWQTRRSLEHGLQITTVPHNGQNMPHWQCTDCSFRSRAPPDPRLLLEQISHAPSGVRYRWLFLAKSHIPAQTSHSKPSDYSYACIICAAQSRTKSAHTNLDTLMSHITAKHKPSMLTPEVLHRTKCIVGRVAGREEDWDVNIYDTRSKSIGSGMGGVIVTAITGVGSESLGRQRYQ